jgi:hypothetical protein
MSQDQTPDPRARTVPACPTCGQPLSAEGELLRCAADGLFFRYGPRLLVHVARDEAARPTLMPWQTLAEPAAR